MKLPRGPWRNAKMQAEHRERVAQIKVALGCMDCGWRESAEALDFDHVGTDKVAAVSRLVSLSGSWRPIAEEILKCEVVCARCHRLRTSERRQRVGNALVNAGPAPREPVEPTVLDQVAVAAGLAAECEPVEPPSMIPPEVVEAAFYGLLIRLAKEAQAEVRLSEIAGLFPQRTKPWVCKRLLAISTGRVAPPTGVAVERALTAGRYRIHHVSGGHTS